ncbi:sex hormone-binding globulin [Sceloporus undulatus]|uniref:sex hormone-binding globulin n=1 Tax=Sceloporus undulatus TaxID=8520 RepID=UPI001C4C5702|nr:sex hormone-binding globulin [Sceloporus undulatus]
MLPNAAWLLFLVLPGLPLMAGEPSPKIEGTYDSKYGQCFQSLTGEAGALNLGQRWGDPSPTATLYIDLRTVTSATSFFDFRTFDPEGVIFYGDTNHGKDWFILALRKGKPEMQIHNSVTNITVSGGLRLNDGRWHRLMVKNEGHIVLLEVDGDDQLVLSHVSKPIIEQPIFDMRIGVGGLFIPAQELLMPLNTAMDGCMRRWEWLNKSLEWREGSSLEEEGTKVCFPSIRHGSFFPGNGLATFSLAGLPTGLSPANGNWSLSVEMRIEGAPQAATLLAISSVKHTPVLRLDLRHTDLVAQLGNKTVFMVQLPAEGCLDLQLVMQITPSHLTLRLANAETLKPIPKTDFDSLKQIWLGQRGDLIIGGLPGSERTPLAQERGFFRGCLRAIRVQGWELDLDAAQSRSNSIWAHSCPGLEDGGKANMDGRN